MNKVTNYPALGYFFGCYLHQDFMLEFGSFEQALQQYINNESIQTQRALIVELTALLFNYPDEAQLISILFEQLGCEYDFLSAWPNGHVWLSHIKQSILHTDVNFLR